MRRQASPTTSRRWRWILPAAMLALAFGGCSDERGNATAPGGGSSGGVGCQDGAARDCSITISEHDGVLTCFSGTQSCVDGAWGVCSDGEFTTKSKPDFDTAYSLSTPAACVNNPCDPYCNEFDEQPGSPITSTDYGVGIFMGAIPAEALPGGFEDKGLKDWEHEPDKEGCCPDGCTATECDNGTCAISEGVSGDCQFDHYCNYSLCGYNANNNWDCGLCKPWGLNDYEASAGGFNLTMPIPCDGGIVVCNRGDVQAPSGIQITVINGNSNQLQDNLGQCENFDGSIDAQCYTTEAIDPGACITVEDATCLDELNGTKGLVVNGADDPSGTANDYDETAGETDCIDNFTVYSGDEGCSECTPSETIVTVNVTTFSMTIDQSTDLYAYPDPSGVGTTTDYFDGIAGGAAAFSADASSAYFNLGNRIWGKGTAGCDETSCDDTACDDLTVAIGGLIAANSPTDTQEGLLLTDLSGNGTGYGSGAPYRDAIAGSSAALQAYAMANSTAGQLATILITGSPRGSCTSNINQVESAASAAASAGVLTYVIGIGGSSSGDGADQGDLDDIAAAGGTGTAYFIDSDSVSGSAAVATQVYNALVAIREANVPCTIDIPPGPGQFHPDLVGVLVAGSTYTKVASYSSCTTATNEYYFDDNSYPTQITLCDSTCQNVLANPGTQVTVRSGCPYDPFTFCEEYQGVCPSDDGSHTQWGYLTWDTVTPDDSYVNFRVRTAPTQADLAGESFTTVGTAQAIPTDTQVCTISDCGVDMYTALGGPPAATQEWLELCVDIETTTDTLDVATVNNWGLTYSCPPSE